MTDEQLITDFEAIYGRKPSLVVKAPGRVNLMGGHTDYNDGFVLPMAVNRYAVMLSAPRKDKVVSIYAKNYHSRVSFSLDNIEHDNEHKWSNYGRGVVRVLKDKGYDLRGMDAFLWGNVPLGAGLSSSAAVESATVATINKMCGLNISTLSMIKFARQAENEFVGVNCGIMDQFASFVSRKDTAVLIDCRSLDYEYVPFKDVKLVVCDTKVERSLAGSSYNERRAECEKGVSIFKKFLPGIKALRDVGMEDFEKYKGQCPFPVGNRVEHVVRENLRVTKSISSLRQGKLEDFGRLMYESHESLRNLYQVSCAELDLIVDAAKGIDGVLGARMTGAGFGGCAIVLVRGKAVDELREKVFEEYTKETRLNPEVYVVEPSDGVHVNSLV